jgi:hypothetical protein
VRLYASGLVGGPPFQAFSATKTAAIFAPSSINAFVMALSVDRLGRSLQDLVGFLAELHALKTRP